MLVSRAETLRDFLSNPDTKHYFKIDSSNIKAQDKQIYIKVLDIEISRKYLVKLFKVIRRNLMWLHPQKKIGQALPPDEFYLNCI